MFSLRLFDSVVKGPEGTCASRLGWVAGLAQVIHRDINIFARRRALQSLESRVHVLETLLGELKAAAPIALRGRIDALEAELDSFRSSTRTQFGRLWHKFRGEGAVERGAADNGIPDDEEFKQLLELQNTGGRH